MQTRDWLYAGLTALLLAGTPAAVPAQSGPERRDSTDVREREVRRQRQGAGVRIGKWQTTGLTQASGASYTTLPVLEGYWQKGLDRHLVLESSAGLWGRTQRSGSDRISSFVIPMLTAVKLYPATGPENPFEPFITAGVGFTLGVDDRNAAAGGLLGGTSGQTGTALIVGIGIKGGAGLEYHLGRAFGVSVGGGYQFIRFLDQVGGDQTYKGLQIFGGLTYRFQY